MSRHYNTDLNLTEKQLDYLCSALFEFSCFFEGSEKESMFKTLDKKLFEAKKRIEKVKLFYAEKNYYKAEMKAKNFRNKL